MRYEIRIPTPRGHSVVKSTGTEPDAIRHRDHFRKVISAGAYIWDSHTKRPVHNNESEGSRARLLTF